MKKCQNPFCQLEEDWSSQYKVYCNRCGYSSAASQLTKQAAENTLKPSERYQYDEIGFKKFKQKILQDAKREANRIIKNE